VLLDVALTTVDVTPSQLLDAARAAEDAGFDGVWIYDHLSGTSFAGRSALDVWSALGALATATERVTLGPLVLNVAGRHPAHIAVGAATVSALCGGRFLLGLGAGAGPGDPFAAELAMLGLPLLGAAERRARVAEAVAYLRALWSGAERFAGEHFRFDAPTGVLAPAPAPPVVVGANGPRMAALAGAVADGVNLHDWEPTLPALIDTARREADRRGAPAFEVSVEASWPTAGSDGLVRLPALGVARAVLRWPPADGVDAIVAVGRRLRG
jgi:alkanesulfonate monooxygenase SsuD/methylene tetrahydromethanopterin reductase-like flavin-dependent oxidoreductase (luciferase family)